MPLLAPLLALALVLVAAPVLGQRVTVESSADCGDEALIISGLVARLPTRQLEGGADGPIRIVFVSRPDGVTATLALQLEEGSTLRRTVSADTCVEAEQAIVFVAAVALDPDADDPVELRAPPPPEDLAPNAAPTEAVTPPPRRHWRWGLAASARVLWGPAPSPLLGGELHIGLTPEHAGWWAPSGRLGVSYQARTGFELPLGSADFSAGLATLDICPSQVVLGPLSARACVEAVSGFVIAAGKDTFEPPQPTPRPWVALGASALLDLRLAPLLLLGLRGSIETPLIRDRTTFDGEPYSEVSVVGAALSAALEARFR